MVRHKVWILLVSTVLFAATAAAQGPCSTTAATSDVICTIPQVFGPGGLGNGGALAPRGGHQGHFESDFQNNISPLTSAVASQLNFLPAASPASGITFTFDKTLGTFVSSNDAYGPILSENGVTLGRHRFYLGVGYQYFAFGSIDGLSLKNLPVTYLHADNCVNGPTPTLCGPPPAAGAVTCSVNGGVTSNSGPVQNTNVCGFVRDYISTQNRVDLKLHQTTFFGSFGLTSRVDLSIAIPIVDVLMGASSDANIVPLSMSGDHVFANPSAAACTASVPPLGSTCYSENFTNARSSTGIGDITVRGKGTIYNDEHNAVAAALDLRFPTGSTNNLQGTGVFGTRLFGIYSYQARISPHANVGYEWNSGHSLLGGDVFTGAKGSLPNEFFYSAGVQAGVVKRLTAAFDLLGQRVFDAQRVVLTDVAVLGACDTPVNFAGTGCSNPGPPSTAPTVSSRISSYNIINAALGLRYNPIAGLLISGSVLIKLDDGGLRAKYVPAVLVSYTFK
jgi:hypothetical protein